MLTVQRTVYTLFDFLSDVGGLAGIFVAGFYLIVKAWTYNSFENFMVSNLFRVKEPDDLRTNKKNEPQPLIIRNLPNCQDLARLVLPRACSNLCKRSRKQKVLQKARDYYKKEINVFQIIRMRRYLMRAVKEILPRSKRELLRQHTKYSSIIADTEGSATVMRSKTKRGNEGIEHEMYDSFFLSTDRDDAISNKDNINAQAEDIS